MYTAVKFLELLKSFFTLWCTSFIFVYPLKHKDYFWLKFAAITVLFAVAALIVDLLNLGIIKATIIAYLLCAFIFATLAKNRWKEVIYCSIWSVCTCKLLLGVWSVILGLSGRPVVITSYKAGLAYLIYLIVACTLIGLTLARFMPVKKEYHIGPRQFTSSVLLLVIFELMDYIMYSHSYISNNIIMAVLIVGGQLYCLTVMYLQQTLFTKSSMRNELETLNLLLKSKKEQYELSKETIQIINQKCHNLKHQIAAFRHIVQEDKRNEFIREIENSVDIYDSMVHTENEALDVILTEKSLYCKKNGIHINCVADGKQMGFIEPVDLYTIFGNALDNAIESVMKIENKDKRFIDVSVHVKQKFLVISIINPFEENLEFHDGLPLSTKPSDGYHGYGLKSIRYAVSKYNGYITIDEKNKCFTLTILIPLAQRN
jgi:hypothetical protein